MDILEKLGVKPPKIATVVRYKWPDSLPRSVRRHLASNATRRIPKDMKTVVAREFVRGLRACMTVQKRKNPVPFIAQVAREFNAETKWLKEQLKRGGWRWA